MKGSRELLLYKTLYSGTAAGLVGKDVCKDLRMSNTFDGQHQVQKQLGYTGPIGPGIGDYPRKVQSEQRSRGDSQCLIKQCLTTSSATIEKFVPLDHQIIQYTLYFSGRTEEIFRRSYVVGRCHNHT